MCKHGDNGVCAERVLVHVILGVTLRLRERLLRRVQAIQLRVRPERVRVHGRAHRLLGHLALVHVARALVEVRPWRKGRHCAQKCRRAALLVRCGEAGAAACAAVRAPNVHVRLLQRADELYGARSQATDPQLAHRAHEASGRGEQVQARVGARIAGRDVRDLEVADDVVGFSHVLSGFMLSRLRCESRLQTGHTLKRRTASTSSAAAAARTEPTTAPSNITGMCCGDGGSASAGALGIMPAPARMAEIMVALASPSSATDTTSSQGAARWFKRPHGDPSGVCTGHMKPQESGRSLRTCAEQHSQPCA